MGGDGPYRHYAASGIVGFFLNLGIIMWAICGVAGVLALLLFLLRVWIDAQ